MSMLKALVGFGLILFSLGAYAGTQDVGPVYLDSIVIIGPSSFGHQAGNMEIKITNGMTGLSGVTCSADYVTTKSSTPNFKEMLSILLAAQIAGKSVKIGITDDASAMAFGGRCSLASVTLLK